MRIIALSGLLIFTGAVTLRAADNDAARFSETANKLIQAINNDDTAAIEESFDAPMREALPPEKATPFFRGIISSAGKLKRAGAPQVAGPTAIVRIAAERGAWDFKITLEPSGKIAGLMVTPAAAKLSALASAQRFGKVANKLIQAINNDDAAAIQAILNAQMQQGLPPEKATPYFRGLLSSAGKLKRAGAPQIAGPTAVVRIAAERGAWDFKITLDESDKIAGFYVTQAGPGPAGEATAVPRSRQPMQLPFRGEWYVFWGGDTEAVNYHVPTPGQRRAADIIIRGAGDLSYKGDGRRNEDYFVYAKEILAAAPGAVVTAIDGVPDNEPGSMNSFSAVGNCLIIDHGSSEYAVYAHLKPGSLRVRRGDKVRAGQPLALCGNSGNSSEPHLHFHLQDKAALQDDSGITPYFTDVTRRRGEAVVTDAEYTFLKGDRIQSAKQR